MTGTASERGSARLLPHLAAVAVAVVIFTLVYDPFHAGALVFLALTPITLVFSDPRVACSVTRAAVCGFGFGWAAAMAIVGPWMYSAAAEYFERGSLWSLGFTLAVNAVYVGLFYAPAFVLLRILAGATPLFRVLGAASVWTLCEALRSAAPAGNTWALLGHGVVDLPLLREAAAFGGVPLLTWFAALGGAALGVGLQPDIGTRDAFRCTRLAVLAPIVLALFGLLARQGDESVAPLQPLRVAVVQQQISSRDVWDPARRMDNWNTYLEATRTLEKGKVDLVVWPESAAPFLLDADAAARTRVVELATMLDAPVILGGPRSEAKDGGRAALHNSVWFFAPGIDTPVTYDKRRLLPFVESMPLEAPTDADYLPGNSTSTFDVKGWQVAPLVCFEALYPELAREAVLQRHAHLLLNLSNDAWFSGGAGPEQHAAMSAMRSVELRRPMVRASNGGVSGAWGIDGAEIGIPLRRQKAVRTYEIPPPPRSETVAARHPEWILWIAGIFAAIGLFDAVRPRRGF
jgi:apolipoprotein N-acyltransferase